MRTTPVRAWILCLLMAAVADAALAVELPAAKQEAVRGAVFEVVFRKSETDSLTYEKPLPLDLIPFKQRNDKFHSFGTAFAIGPNRFATAAHVFIIGFGSQYGDPLLRDSDGSIYELDQVLAMSIDQDFAVFSLRKPPRVQPLATNATPTLNRTVYAVGNALGEGIVIRDGLYTSKTPETRDGRWDWLRFSAAASPGNSGGPLLDASGQVIGIVLRKSENENLNYAMPIGPVLAAPRKATIDSRAPYRVSLMAQTRTVNLKHNVALPLQYGALTTVWREPILDQLTTIRKEYFAEFAADTFPRGQGSVQQLHTLYTAAFPLVLMRNDDGRWDAMRPNDVQTADLGANGFMAHGDLASATWVQLRRPDGVSLEKLYGDSKLLMDYLLKGVPMRRQVGSDSVRITSAGAGKELAPYVDAHGRKWRSFQWLLEYNDTALSVLALPVPAGYAAIVRGGSTSGLEITREDSRMLADFSYVSYIGTAAQWREFLRFPQWHPAALSTIKLALEPNSGFGYESKRLRYRVAQSDFALTDTGYLGLQFTYFNEAGKPVWDVGQLTLSTDSTSDIGVSITRVIQPPTSLSDDYRDNWRNLSEGRYPYTGVPVDDEGKTYVMAPVSTRGRVPADTSQPEVRYSVVYSRPGKQSARKATQEFRRVTGGLEVLER
jgi:serine protease Do